MNKRRWLFISVFILTGVIIWNYPTTYKVGINGKVIKKHIPLYAKACAFLYRDWMYKDIVGGIVAGKRSDTEKVLAILHWTRENISSRVPPDLKIVDDHPLNIIIRQYGAEDQLEDIFTLLCAYAGMRAGMVKCYNPAKTRHIVLSFVRAEGKWLIFDVSANKYFLNGSGSIGSVEDYMQGDLVLSGEISPEDGMLYSEFLSYIPKIDFSAFSRTDEQMPARRLAIQIKKIFYSEGRPAGED